MRTCLIAVLITGVLCFSSPAWSERRLTLLEPVGGEAWVAGEHAIRWELGGDGWTGTETLTIECTGDYGETWSIWAIDVSAAAGVFTWDISGLPAGPDYQVRIECNEAPSAWDISGAFWIGSVTAYYVNDTAQEEDVFCVASGSPTANGVTPETPNTSVQYIIDTYALQPGDTIWVDTGRYTLGSNIALDAGDQGAESNPLRVLGSPNGTVFDRNNTESVYSAAFKVTGDYVQLGDWLNPLEITRGFTGIIMEGTGCQIRACTVYGCTNLGVKITGNNSALIDSFIRDNGWTGVHISTSQNVSVVANSVIRDNAKHGIQAEAVGADIAVVDIHHNTITGNGDCGIYAYTLNDNEVRVVNNTLAGNVSHALYGRSEYGDYRVRLTARNNVIQSEGPGSSCVRLQVELAGILDYNTYHAVNGAATGYFGEQPYALLSEWRAAVGQDAHSLPYDPLFADSENGVYTLMSTGGRLEAGQWVADGVSSRAIDAGDPADDVSLESEPNGGRANQGAYGRQVRASRSPVERLLTLLEPLGGEIRVAGERAIRWNLTGQAWDGTETLSIEYTHDGGATWTLLEGAAAAAAGSFPWDMSGLPDGPSYRVRIYCNEDVGTEDESGPFRMGEAPGQFFVNDASTSGDVYCTAAGTVSGSGISPATPAAAVQSILDAYTLRPGDIVWIDTGTYSLDADIFVGLADYGSEGDPVVFAGSPNGSLLDRNAPEISDSRAFHVDGAHIQVGDADAPIQITGAGQGVYLAGLGGAVRNCELHGCGGQGVLVTGLECHVRDCVVRDNGGRGIDYRPSEAAGPGSVQGNVAYNNSGHGIYVNNYNGPMEITNNLSVNNGASGIYLRQSGDLLLANNTVAGNQLDGVYHVRAGSAGTFISKNNIIHTDGVGKMCIHISTPGLFDYNTYYATGGAGIGYYDTGYNNTGGAYMSLGGWRAGTGQDAHSLSADPRFVDPLNGDYHLMSTESSYHGGAWLADVISSPAIDAGDPADGAGDETEPEGCRINQGAYGGTAVTSRTPFDRVLTLLEPVGGEAWTQEETPAVRWQYTGQTWSGAETLTLAYSENDGETWAILESAVPAAAGVYSWDLAGFPTGPRYRLRITCNEDPAASDASAIFRIGTGMNFYVNDSFTENDFYCTAPGVETADGASPATPNTDIRYILNTYRLMPGDQVWVDTGQYLLTENIVITDADRGVEGNPIQIKGSPNGAVLDRNAAGDASSRVFDIYADHIQLGETGHPLKCTGASVGISIHDAEGGVVRNCEIHGCTEWAVNLYVKEGNTVQACRIYNNGNGIYCCPYFNTVATIAENDIYDNSGEGIHAFANVNSEPHIAIEYNEVKNNGSYGIKAGNYYTRDAVYMTGNRITGNGNHAVYAYSYELRLPPRTCVTLWAMGNYIQPIPGKKCFHITTAQFCGELIGNICLEDGIEGEGEALEGESSEGEMPEGEISEGEDEGEGEGDNEGENEGEVEGELPVPHPADVNEDFRMLLSEAIAYLAGWQQGGNPIAYAIRAAYLWQNGEAYTYNPALEEPLCWELTEK